MLNEAKIYQTEEELLNEDYLNLMTLANSVQQMVIKDDTYEMYKGESAESSFSQFFDLLVKFDFLPSQDLPQVQDHINGQIENFFKSQDVITPEDFAKTKELNRKFLTLFWSDLKMYKTFDIIIDIAKKIVVPQHQSILGNIMNEETVMALAKAGLQEEHIILYSIAKEDKSLITITSLYIPNEGKEEMMNFYNTNNLIKNKEDNYEQYMLDILRGNMERMKAEKEASSDEDKK
jgi:hypothetical protein